MESYYSKILHIVLFIQLGILIMTDSDTYVFAVDLLWKNSSNPTTNCLVLFSILQINLDLSFAITYNLVFKFYHSKFNVFNKLHWNFTHHI